MELVCNSLTTLLNQMSQHFQSSIIEDISAKVKTPLFVAGPVPDLAVQYHYMVPVKSDKWGIWR